jgi:hypothetical protein
MKAKLFGVVALLVLFGAMPSRAASLIDEGTNTYDPNTGLQWLDVNLTLGVTYNDVVANYLGTGQPYQGYRYATGAELSQLLSDAGISNPIACNTLCNPSELSSYTEFFSLLSPTFTNTWTTMIEGRIADNFICGDLLPCHWFALIDLQSDGQGGYVEQRARARDYGIHDTESGIYADQPMGNFLVLDVGTTPLPATLPLFASGLGVLGALGWRRKRKAAALAA